MELIVFKTGFEWKLIHIKFLSPVVADLCVRQDVRVDTQVTPTGRQLIRADIPAACHGSG
jgi:hypothetical protein